MLSFDCPVCGEREKIKPLSDVIISLEELEIKCLECGFTGKPDFFISDCKNEVIN